MSNSKSKYMKRYLFLLMALCSMCLSASAYVTAVIDGICYDISETTATVTSGREKYSGDIVIPESITFENSIYSVTSIGYAAFEECYSLTSVTIPNSVASIEDEAFYNCNSLTSVTIPNSVTSIGDKAFSRCYGLSSVTIPNSVTSIGERAFQSCSYLTSVTIPNSVTSIGYGTFEGCSWLTSVTIPNSVTSIGNWAFSGCESLTSITIPNSVTSIGYGAFYECRSLTSVTIPNSVTSIGESAFSECRRFTSVTIPNSVTSIGDKAFYNCYSLNSVTIPNSVTSIGKEAFAYCRYIENVYCYAEEVPSADLYAFYYWCIYATLHVPASAIEAYKTTKPWSDFRTIKDIEDAVGIESVKDRGIAIQSASGFINISGLDNNETVSFYALNGKALGTAKSIDGNVSFSAKQGAIVVARIGKESVKIAVK